MPELIIPASENKRDVHVQEGISLVGGLPGFLGYRFNPQALVKAVNYLQRLGRATALRTLREYCVLAEEKKMANPENALLAARILFVRKDRQQSLPSLQLGQPDLVEPADATILPLFPLYLHHDLPMLLIAGYLVGGEGLPPSVYIDWCMGECDIRSEPLAPVDDPLASMAHFLESSIWKSLQPSNAHTGMLRLQAIRAVSNVYTVDPKSEMALKSGAAGDETWRRVRSEVASLHIQWNPEADEYQ